MRSEERSGVIALILLLLWGTFISKPLRLFTDSLYRLVASAAGAAGLSEDGIIFSIIIVFIFCAASVALLIICRYRIGIFIPCCAMLLSTTVFVIDLLNKKSFEVSDAAALGITLALLAVLYIASADRILVWVTDCFILALDVFLIASLFTKPLARISGVLDKLLYINKTQEVRLTRGFAGLLGIPEIIWGIFILILALLPNIYYCFSRKVK